LKPAQAIAFFFVLRVETGVFDLDGEMLMAKYNSPLDRVTVAAPCSADWDAMIGNDRARFCGQCKLNVYNLSGMTKREAERLIAGAEGRLCVRFYRRADGTVLTENCPVGLRALKRRVSRVASAMLSAILSFLAGLGLYTALDERKPATTMGTIAVNPVTGAATIKPSPVVQGEMALPVIGQPAPPYEKIDPARIRAGRRKR
jgi:hypothetical protein